MILTFTHLWIYNCLCKYCKAWSTSLSTNAQASSGRPSWKYRSRISRQDPNVIRGDTTYSSRPWTNDVRYGNMFACCNSFRVRMSCWKQCMYKYNAKGKSWLITNNTVMLNLWPIYPDLKYMLPGLFYLWIVLI